MPENNSKKQQWCPCICSNK